MEVRPEGVNRSKIALERYFWNAVIAGIANNADNADNGRGSIERTTRRGQILTYKTSKSCGIPLRAEVFSVAGDVGEVARRRHGL
jgi:hypothetical protein